MGSLLDDSLLMPAGEIIGPILFAFTMLLDGLPLL